MRFKFSAQVATILTLSLILVACNSGTSSTTTSNSAYTMLTYPNEPAGNSTIITGIRGVPESSNVYYSGIYGIESGKSTISHGLMYQGPINGGGTWYILNYPSASGRTVTSTSLYGPNYASSNNNIQVVGNYTTAESTGIALGLLYQGNIDGSTTDGWTTLNPSSLSSESLLNTIAHSVNGGFVVGNYDTVIEAGKAFIYDIANESYYALTRNDVVSITAYGIWYNGGTSYTIAGGLSQTDHLGLSKAYLVDWDSSTHTTSHWREYNYDNINVGIFVTHFEGITSDNNGGYNLAADWTTYTDGSNTGGSSFVHIPRNNDQTFGDATWTTVYYPGSSTTSANTVFESYTLGVYMLPGESTTNSYVVSSQ